MAKKTITTAYQVRQVLNSGGFFCFHEKKFGLMFYKC